MKHQTTALRIVLTSLVLILGLANSWFALRASVPHQLDVILEFFPLSLLHLSRTLVLFSGISMIIIADNVWKQKKRAWSVLVFLLLISMVFHWFKDKDWFMSLSNGGMLLILWYFRDWFTVLSESWTQARAIKVASLWLMGVLLYATFGFFLFAQDFSQPVSIPLIIHDYAYGLTGIGTEQLLPQTRNGMWFTHSITLISLLGLSLSFSSLFMPLIWTETLTQADRQTIRALILQSSTNPSSYFALLGDKQIFFNRTRTCFLAYKVNQTVAIILGDPVGQRQYWEGTIIECVQQLHARGLILAFVNVTEVNLFQSLGYKQLKIGEEALIKLSAFSLSGPQIAEVRHSVARLSREQARYEWYRMDEVPWKALAAIEDLHANWLSNRKGPELTFSVDFYPLPIEPNAWVLCVWSPQGKLWAALSFLPYAKKRLVVELMLRSSQSPNGTMEAAFAESMLHFQRQKYHWLSLGLAPLSDIDPSSQEKVLGKTRQLIFQHFNQVYGYKSLFKFKQKFNPIWESRYLMYENNLALPKTITALVGVHLKDKRLVQSLVRKYLQ